MTQALRLRLLIPLILLGAVAVWLLSGQRDEIPVFQGYVEGEYLYLAAPLAGDLKTLDVPRGERVETGKQVFAIEPDPDTQGLQAADAQTAAAKARLDNLQAPRRPPEIVALEGQLRAAQAAVALSARQLAQQRSLQARQFVSQARLDEVQAIHARDLAQVESVQAQIETYRLSVGRDAEKRSAEADIQAAHAQAEQKRWLVQRKQVLAPATGEITETYYRPGEWVPAGAPVASLLPDTRRRIRFFVPETMLANIGPGMPISVSCDGCAAPFAARIDFISSQAEYTPPVIYSRGSREKLVFRIEAVTTPEQAARLRPGLPLDIRLQSLPQNLPRKKGSNAGGPEKPGKTPAASAG